MKITIYELLGLVKDGKSPKKIKYNGIELEYNEGCEDYYSYYGNGLFEYKFGNLSNNFLNGEVEIIEEEPKPITKESIEALGYACGEIRKCFENGLNKSLENKPLIEEEKKIEYPILHKTAPSETTGDQMPNWRNLIDCNFEYLNKTICQLIDEINNLKEK